jgi:hypothetical protein
MNTEGILVKERINEATKMCEREQPVYEQISNFSIVLYIFGYFNSPDLLSVDDVDNVEAGAILKEHFEEIKKEDIPLDYNIISSPDRYLLVFGDPLFPTHFAAVTDMRSIRPFFSKLPFFGSGYDSLKELKMEFAGTDDITSDDIHWYKWKRPAESKQKSAKIYTIRDDGNYEVMEYKYAN